MERRIFAEAYELKDGGFRGLAKDFRTNTVQRGEVRPTLNEAKRDAHNFAVAMLAGRPYASGTYRSPRNAWKMNYWVAA